MQSLHYMKEEFLDKNIPVFYYNKVIRKESAEELQSHLRLEYTYYVDNDERFLGMLNSDGAINFEDLDKYV